MAHRGRLIKITIGILAAIVLLVAASASIVVLDVRRGGCESGGQLLGPVSSEGQSISNAAELGACFISFVAIEGRDIQISHVVCSRGVTLASCHALRKEVSSGWSDFVGSKCTSLSFIGGADCNCAQTGDGCFQGAWPVEVIP